MAKKQLFDPKSTAPFSLSRSKLTLYLDCSCCFYFDRRLGISRPPSFPYTLNNAVDTLMKKEFDVYRKAQKPHFLMTQAGIDAIPFQHPDLDKTWRSNFKGLGFHDAKSNIVLSGAIDDLWRKPNGELIVADYKATSTTGAVSLDENKDVFKRQLEVYQWIFRQNGFTVDEMACLVYANARKDRPDFSGKLEFDMSILCHTGSTDWIKPALMDVRACLSADKPPLPKKTVNKKGVEEYCCKYCEYYAERSAVV